MRGHAKKTNINATFEQSLYLERWRQFVKLPVDIGITTGEDTERPGYDTNQ